MRFAVQFLLLSTVLLAAGNADTLTWAALPSCWFLDAAGCVDLANDSFAAMIEQFTVPETRPNGITRWNEPDRIVAEHSKLLAADRADVSVLNAGDMAPSRNDARLTAEVLSGAPLYWHATMAKGL